MSLAKSFLIVIAFGTCLAWTSQDLEFWKENITMRYDNGYFYVTGTYYYRNNSNESKLLYYPFPQSDLYGVVDSVLIFDLVNEQPLKAMKKSSEGFLYVVDFSSGREAVIQVSYRHHTPHGRAEYIIKTTRDWLKPLQEAYYQLIVPSDLIVRTFSIPPGDSIIAGNEKVYTWEKYNYVPERNIIFEFK